MSAKSLACPASVSNFEDKVGQKPDCPHCGGTGTMYLLGDCSGAVCGLHCDCTAGAAPERPRTDVTAGIALTLTTVSLVVFLIL